MRNLRVERHLQAKMNNRMGIYKLHDWKFGALVGNMSTGVIDVPGKDSTIYVTPVGGGAVMEAVNTAGVLRRLGNAIMVGYSPENPAQLRVLEAWQAYGTAETPADDPTNPKWYEWPYDKAIHIWGEVIMWYLIRPVGNTLSVTIWPGITKTPSGWKKNPQPVTIDMTSHVPSTTGKARYSIIVVDAAGAYAVRDGTEITGWSNLTTANYPTLTYGDSAKWAIKLRKGQTKFRMYPSNVSDFDDLRWSFAGSVASGTVTAVTGTVPIVSSGGASPAISITAATTGAAGSMSGADKTKLDAATPTPTATTIAEWDVNKNINFNSFVGGVAIINNPTGSVSFPATNPYITRVTGTPSSAKIIMPDATTLTQGITYRIVNDITSTTIPVYLSDGIVQLASMQGGADWSFTVKDNTINTTASWLKTSVMNSNSAINTSSPLAGGGAMSTNRTISMAAATNAADGYMTSTAFARLENTSGTNTGDQPTDGWNPASGTWSYSSADAPTFVISVNADMTGIISVGKKIKLTQTTVKYFIVTAVGAYSGGATLITVYGGTDYTLAAAAITAPFYSGARAPFGFPMAPDKWTIELSDTTSRSQATPTATTWYNLGSLSISIPIGVWDVMIQYAIRATIAVAGTIVVYASLSTANNSNSDGDFTGFALAASLTDYSALMTRRKVITLASKTTYYPVAMTTMAAATNIYFQNSGSALKVFARCAYL